MYDKPNGQFFQDPHTKQNYKMCSRVTHYLPSRLPATSKGFVSHGLCSVIDKADLVSKRRRSLYNTVEVQRNVDAAPCLLLGLFVNRFIY
jgi:hypothetical protein